MYMTRWGRRRKRFVDSREDGYFLLKVHLEPSFMHIVVGGGGNPEEVGLVRRYIS